MGKRALHEAANLLSSEQVSLQTKLALIEALPQIIRESARPMERIEGIKILQVDGLNAGGSGGGTSAPQGGGNLAEDVVRSALRYRAQAPIVDALLGEIGMKEGLSNPLAAALADATSSKENGHRGANPMTSGPSAGT
ncbi:MAG: flotillin domain-containing protein [Polyangiales bacterium]